MSKYISRFRRGDTKQITVSRSGKDSSGSPVPVPFLSGSTLTFSLKSDIDRSDHPYAPGRSPGGLRPLDDLDAGICIISLPSNQTALLEAGKYYWISSSSKTRHEVWQQRLWRLRQATGRTGFSLKTTSS